MKAFIHVVIKNDCHMDSSVRMHLQALEYLT